VNELVSKAVPRLRVDHFVRLAHALYVGRLNGEHGEPHSDLGEEGVSPGAVDTPSQCRRRLPLLHVDRALQVAAKLDAYRRLVRSLSLEDFLAPHRLPVHDERHDGLNDLNQLAGVLAKGLEDRANHLLPIVWQVRRAWRSARVEHKRHKVLRALQANAKRQIAPPAPPDLQDDVLAGRSREVPDDLSVSRPRDGVRLERAVERVHV